jgi:hypothetical protein
LLSVALVVIGVHGLRILIAWAWRAKIRPWFLDPNRITKAERDPYFNREYARPTPEETAAYHARLRAEGWVEGPDGQWHLPKTSETDTERP